MMLGSGVQLLVKTTLLRHFSWKLLKNRTTSRYWTTTGRHYTDMAANRYGLSSGCQITVADNQSSFEAKLPGWSSSDINVMAVELDKPWYLRIWRVLFMLDWVREAAKRHGFLDMDQYEKTHLTYFKCSNMQRETSLKELESLGGLPYQYGITVKCYLSRIGNTSCQLDHEIICTESGQLLLTSSLVSVSVNPESRKVDKNPGWWVDKYRGAVMEKPALRVNMPKAHPGEDLISKSEMIVQPLDLDYYGHANNTSYFTYAMNGLLNANLPWSVVDIEKSTKTIEVDFISDCTTGDHLETRVYKDNDDIRKYYIDIHKANSVIYSQMILLDSMLMQKL